MKMTPPKYENPRDYKTKGVFTQTADAEALIQYAAMLNEMGKIASVQETADDIREMIIVDGSSISRIIAHFAPMEHSAAIRVETLFVVGSDVQESAEAIVANPDMFYNRRSAVPVGRYTEDQVRKKIKYISSAYAEAMTEGAKKMERTPSQPGSQTLDDKIEDPLDLCNMVIDTSDIDAKALEAARAVPEKPIKLPPLELKPLEEGDNSLTNLVTDYITGKGKK